MPVRSRSDKAKLCKTNIGILVHKHRLLTEKNLPDYGKVYGLSQSAVHKIESGDMLPLIKTWLKIAKDAGISKSEAVYFWIQDKLPLDCRNCVAPVDIAEDIEKPNILHKSITYETNVSVVGERLITARCVKNNRIF